MASILGFDNAAVFAGVVLSFYLREALHTVVESQAAQYVERIARVVAINIATALFITLGAWRNVWLVRFLKVGSIDTMFAYIARIMGITSIIFYVLQFNHYMQAATIILNSAMVPLMIACFYGYANMLRTHAKTVQT